MRILLCLLIVSSLIGFQLTSVCHAQADDVTALIVQLRESKDIYQRRRAAKALGEIEAQPREMMLKVASALMAELGNYPKDDSLRYYIEESLKRVRFSTEDAFDVWVNNHSVWVENWLGETSVPLLCELLNKPHNLGNRHDSFLRDRTARALIGLGPSMPNVAVPALIKALKNRVFGAQGDDFSREFHSQVAFALGAIGEPAIADLLNLLRDENRDDYACYHASTALMVMDPPPVTIVPALLDILENGDRHNQWAVIEVLQVIGEPAKAAVPLLIDLLSDNSPSYLHFSKLGVVRALGAMGPAAEAAVPALTEVLDDPRPHSDFEVDLIRANVIDALGEIGPAAQVALPKIAEALNDNNIMVRTAAVSALGKLNAPLSASKIIELCYDEDWGLPQQALMALANLPDPFDNIMSASNPPTLNEASVLAQRDHARPALLNGLTSPRQEIRLMAAMAFSQMDPVPKEAVNPLIKALSSDTKTVMWAAHALVRIGTQQALDAVFTLLKDKDLSVRFAGARALADLDAPPRDATKPLIAVLGDKYQPVHRNAVIALRKIGTVEAIKAVDRVELGLK